MPIQKSTADAFTRFSDDEDEPYDYHEMMTYLLKQYGYDVQDMGGAKLWYDSWCDAQGYGTVDPDGKSRKASKLWHAEYEKAEDGKITEPPTLDFTEWLFKNYPMPFGETVFIWVSDELKRNHPPHVRMVLEALQKDFGDEVPLCMHEM